MPLAELTGRAGRTSWYQWMGHFSKAAETLPGKDILLSLGASIEVESAVQGLLPT